MSIFGLAERFGIGKITEIKLLNNSTTKTYNSLIFKRETRDSVDIKRASVLVQKHFTTGRGFEAKSLFIVTWDDVGYFDQGSDKVGLLLNVPSA